MKKLFWMVSLVSLVMFAGCVEDEDDNYTPTQQVNLVFEESLSDMGIFQGDLNTLTPANDVVLYELNSSLFTDFAKKQRLIRLPEGTTMEFNGTELQPDFPDNTLMAKTFYYNFDDRDPSLGRQIIETRVFIKVDGVWISGDYIWNETQTQATYRETSSVEPITFIDSDGFERNIDYVIPSNQECASCHNNNNVTRPIGFKLRSLNFNPNNGTVNENQLDYLISRGMLTGVTPSQISLLPDWTDIEAYDIFERSRAYIDINCAHCHQPGGEIEGDFNIDFRYETPFEETGIFANRGDIEARFESTDPMFRMPQLGRTVVHEDALAMLLEYLEAIED